MAEDSQPPHNKKKPRELKKEIPQLLTVEIQLLDLIITNKSGPEIAEAVGLRQASVRVYMSNLYKKIGFNNRTQAAVWWSQLTLRQRRKYGRS